MHDNTKEICFFRHESDSTLRLSVLFSRSFLKCFPFYATFIAIQFFFHFFIYILIPIVYSPIFFVLFATIPKIFSHLELLILPPPPPHCWTLVPVPLGHERTDPAGVGPFVPSGVPDTVCTCVSLAGNISLRFL